MSSEAKCLYGKGRKAMEVRQMWDGGPKRQVAMERSKSEHSMGFIPYGSEGLFAGQYVCDKCERLVPGLYRVDGGCGSVSWLCAGCKDELGPKQEQPEGLRRHREAK